MTNCRKRLKIDFAACRLKVRTFRSQRKNLGATPSTLTKSKGTTMDRKIEINHVYYIENRSIRDLLGDAFPVFCGVYRHGMTVKQVRRAMYKAGAEIDDRTAELLGNCLVGYHETVNAMFHNCVWWRHSYDFGDSESCFFRQRARVIPDLVRHGALFVTWWDTRMQPLGRSIVLRFRDIETYPAIDRAVDGWFVFNTYSKEDVSWTNYDAAYALASLFDYPHVQRHENIYYDNRSFLPDGDFYLNSRVAWSVSTHPINNVDDFCRVVNDYKRAITPTCSACGHSLINWDTPCPRCQSAENHALRVIPTRYDFEDVVFYDCHPLTGEIVERTGRVEMTDLGVYQIQLATEPEPCWTAYTSSTIEVRHCDGRWVRVYGRQTVLEGMPHVVEPSQLLYPKLDKPVYVKSLNSFLLHTNGVYRDEAGNLRVGALRWYDEVSIVEQLTDTLYYHESSETYYRLRPSGQLEAVTFLADGQEVLPEAAAIVSLNVGGGRYEYLRYPNFLASAAVHNKFWPWARAHAVQFIDQLRRLDPAIYQYVYQHYYNRGDYVRS